MLQKSPYRTRQQELLIQYVKSTKGVHFTAEDVIKHFAQAGETIGSATVYRHLEKMANEHFINKYFIDEHSAACFEYMDEDHCKEESDHFHLKCTECGKLIHLECEEINFVKKHFLSDHGFELDSFRTVFYGKCNDCRSK